MKKKQLSFLFTAALLLQVLYSFAQTDSIHTQHDSLQKKFKVVIFTPLYLDSAFDASGVYKFDKQFPKFINPGLEFYEGVQLALDSLKQENVPLEVYIIDTRSTTKKLEQQLNAPEIQDAGLFIGYVTAMEERVLAAAALRKNIAFINVNLPNDAGISNNASLVILNATLKTHCEGIYRFLQKYYSLTPVTVFRKKGAMEDRLKNYWTDFEKTTAGVKLNMKFITLDENNIGDLQEYFDSTHLMTAIVGSMDDNFGKAIAQRLAILSKSYPILLVGMPTWDVAIDFTKKEYKGIDIVYSTPFYNPQTDNLSSNIINYFNTNMYSRPSDMVFRGYECMYRFGKLLVEKGSNLSSSIGEKKYRVFTDFDIQPVLNKQTMTLDYFENKKLYFVKKGDGVVKQVY